MVLPEFLYDEKYMLSVDFTHGFFLYSHVTSGVGISVGLCVRSPLFFN